MNLQTQAAYLAESLAELDRALGHLAYSANACADTGTALRKAVGFRNLSVHAYDQVDWQRVFEIIHHRIHDFRSFSQSINEWSDRHVS